MSERGPAALSPHFEEKGTGHVNEILKITSVRVYPNPEQDERLKGFASIVLNNQFAICDLKIIRGHRGLFVAFPSRRRRDGSFHDVCHPIVHELREAVETTVLGEYRMVTD
jgi:stage V sporulation protein G